MASELRVNTLKDAAGNNSIATSFVAGGSAKVWVNFNGTGTIATRDSLNVSGLTDNGTGNYAVAYSSNMGSANYALGNSGADSGTVFECWLGSGYGLPTSSNTGLGSGYDTPVAADLSIVTSMIMGDLA
jgi:hypothetical protein